MEKLSVNGIPVDDKRDEKGRFGAGNTANPGGKPYVWKEYRKWLEEECLPEVKKAFWKCLTSDDEKVQMMAVKEVHDRLFGKARQQVSIDSGDGKSAGADILGILQRLSEKK